jgi:hypothetical protein
VPTFRSASPGADVFATIGFGGRFRYLTGSLQIAGAVLGKTLAEALKGWTQSLRPPKPGT